MLLGQKATPGGGQTVNVKLQSLNARVGGGGSRRQECKQNLK